MTYRVDWWKMAHDLLYPGKPYAELVKPERFRITELARRMAGIKNHRPPPPIDDALKAIIETLDANRPKLDARNQYILDVG